MRPDRRQHDVVLAAVKEWPGSAGACLEHSVAAILDGSCARRHGLRQVGTKKRLSGRTKKRTRRGWRAGAVELACALRGGRARFPRRAAGDDRVGEDQQLAGAGDDGNLMLLSGGP